MAMTRAANLFFVIALSACSVDREPRIPETPVADNPATTNDESNDQAVGHHGTVTLCVSTPHNGRSYTLDANVDGGAVSEVYFPKGGNVDFDDCELNDELSGECVDENGKTWEFTGEC